VKRIEKRYNTREAARLLGISERSLYREMERFRLSGGREGLGPWARNGNRNLFPESTLTKFQENTLIAV
jgi:hypothetical protein